MTAGLPGPPEKAKNRDSVVPKALQSRARSWAVGLASPALDTRDHCPAHARLQRQFVECQILVETDGADARTDTAFEILI